MSDEHRRVAMRALQHSKVPADPAGHIRRTTTGDADLDAMCERLRSQGVRLVYDAPRRGTANSRINFIHPKDGGGVLIELVEPAS